MSIQQGKSSTFLSPLIKSKQKKPKNDENLSSTGGNILEASQSFYGSFFKYETYTSISNIKDKMTLWEDNRKLKNRKRVIKFVQSNEETEPLQININNINSKINKSNLNLKNVKPLPNSNDNDASPRTDLKRNKRNKKSASDGPYLTLDNFNNKISKTGSKFANMDNINLELHNKIDQSIKNPYNEFIEHIQSIIKSGIKQSVYFLNKDLLNSEDVNEKFVLEKILKINSFCEKIESIEMYSKIFKKTSTNQISNIEAKYINTDSVDLVRNTNILEMATERRISVYQALFENIENTLKDIIFITTQLKEINQENPINYGHNHKNNPSNKYRDENKNRDKQELGKSNTEKASNLIAEQKIIDNNKLLEFYDIMSHSNPVMIKKSFSSSENSLASIHEGDFDINLPKSMIKNVNLLGDKQRKFSLIRNFTHKDYLLHIGKDIQESDFYQRNIKLINFSKNTETEPSDPIFSLGGNFLPFFKAREELDYHNKLHLEYEKK